LELARVVGDAGLANAARLAAPFRRGLAVWRRLAALGGAPCAFAGSA
jgi:hypothetical protein